MSLFEEIEFEKRRKSVSIILVNMNNYWIVFGVPLVVTLGIWIYAEKDIPKSENSNGVNEWIGFIPLYICALLLWMFILSFF